MDDDHTLELKDGTRILVVDGVGKPFPLTAKMREILREGMPTIRKMAEADPDEHKPGDPILYAEQDVAHTLGLLEAVSVDPRKVQDPKLENLLIALEPNPEPIEPLGPPKPRRSKRERRGSWRK